MQSETEKRPEQQILIPVYCKFVALEGHCFTTSQRGRTMYSVHRPKRHFCFMQTAIIATPNAALLSSICYALFAQPVSLKLQLCFGNSFAGFCLLQLGVRLRQLAISQTLTSQGGGAIGFGA